MSQVASVFNLFEFSRAFCDFRLSGLSSNAIKTNVAADSALFWRMPEKENKFRDVFKEFPIIDTISASEIVVLGRARSVFYAAKFKMVKTLATWLILKITVL